MKNIRLDHELPEATERWGWKFHHLGIPTEKKMPGEKYLPQFKFYVSGFPESPFGIEWMRFEKNSPVHPLIQKVPHLAFEVKSLELELKAHNLKIITPPYPPSNGIRVAMIEYHGAPVELIEFNKNNG
ncbi:hypothetical protein GM418_01580 [Maribellus comscasis]|uniref:VOC domain-containing protein n=1 Tax=Maribellus comscasis TaxID=2681766 RepID=A0A6I6JMQ3_9BACT|nr:hypothetical protein [Maribellus comscasis]QGY42389.1 hypothetical protein GM418_01580 [Maribellus comscasis]